jgi:hypothetical protein
MIRELSDAGHCVIESDAGIDRWNVRPPGSKTRPIRVNGPVPGAISHAIDLDFPLPWSGDIPTGAISHRSLTWS